MADLRDSRPWLIAAAILVAGWLLWLLSPVLTPFVVSALLAYLSDPLVDRLERFGLNRTLSVSLVFVLMLLVLLGVLLLLIPMIESQIRSLIDNLPQYIEWVQTRLLPWLEQRFGIDLQALDVDRVKVLIQEHWKQAGGVAAAVLATASRSGFAILIFVMNLLLIPVVTFYLLRDWDKLLNAVQGLMPRRNEATITELAHQSDQVLGAFLRGQLAVMVSLGVFYCVGLWLVGLDLAFLVGIIAGMISFVPYLGCIVGILMGVIAAIVQFQDFIHVALVLGIFGIGQVLETMLLTPWLVGDRIGLHPVAVIFAVMAGGQLFGFIGVLVALPVAAVVMVLLRHAHRQYKGSTLYKEPQTEVTSE